MATYPVKNIETGETKDVIMSVHVWSQWCEDNPEWQRYYTPENAPSLGVESVGDWQDKLKNKHPSWNEIVKKSERAGGISGRLARKGSVESSTTSAHYID